MEENFKTDDKITNCLGIKLGNCLANSMTTVQSEATTEQEKRNAEVAGSLIERLGDMFKVSFIGKEVSLCGYMYKKGEQWRELYFWNGIADAIGWDENEGRFFIVEWKVKEEKKINQTEAFKPFKFQTLVYAKLLKLLSTWITCHQS